MTKKEPLSVLQQSLLFVGIIFCLYLFGSLIYHLTPILTPFAIAAVLAYLADPLVERLCKGKWKISRTFAAVLVFLAVILLFLVIILFLVPALQNQLSSLVAKTPAMLEWIQNQLFPQLVALGIATDDLGFDTFKTVFSKHMSQASEVAKWMWQALFHSGIAIVGWLMNFVIVIVATFYLLRDWRSILNAIQTLLPKVAAPTIVSLAKRCDEVLATFMRGQLTVMVTLGVFYSIGLALLGVNFSLLLGMIIGFLSLVPYLGCIVGLGSALIVTYLQFHAWMPIILVSILFTIGNLLEGMVLTPVLVGDKLGLHPVVVIFAILAGGQLLGFVGIVIAIPIMAILVVLVNELLNRLQKGEQRG